MYITVQSSKILAGKMDVASYMYNSTKCPRNMEGQPARFKDNYHVLTTVAAPFHFYQPKNVLLLALGTYAVMHSSHHRLCHFYDAVVVDPRRCKNLQH